MFVEHGVVEEIADHLERRFLARAVELQLQARLADGGGLLVGVVLQSDAAARFPEAAQPFRQAAFARRRQFLSAVRRA